MNNIEEAVSGSYLLANATELAKLQQTRLFAHLLVGGDTLEFYSRPHEIGISILVNDLLVAANRKD